MDKTLSQIGHEDSIEALEREKAQLMNVWASEDGRAERALVRDLNAYFDAHAARACLCEPQVERSKFNYEMATPMATDENTLIIPLPETPPLSFYMNAPIRSMSWDKLSEDEREEYRRDRRADPCGICKERPSFRYVWWGTVALYCAHYFFESRSRDDLVDGWNRLLLDSGEKETK